MTSNYTQRKYAPEYETAHPRNFDIDTGAVWSSRNQSRRKWGLQNGVHPTVFPFTYVKKENPLDIMLSLVNYLEAREPHQQRLTTSRILSVTGSGANTAPYGSHRDAMIMRGWWPGGQENSSGVYFCNPEYVHSHGSNYALSERERAKMLYISAAYYRRTKMLAPMFGYFDIDDPAAEVAHCAQRIGVAWAHERALGRDVMARMIKTLRAWGYTVPVIAHAFNYPTRTTYDLSALVPEYHPPEDPSYRYTDDPGTPESIPCGGCGMSLVKEARGQFPIDLPEPDQNGESFCFACSTEDHLEKMPTYRPPADQRLPLESFKEKPHANALPESVNAEVLSD